jgi:hypothetical protein
MNRHLRIWKRILTKRRGLASADALIVQIKHEHDQLQASQPRMPKRYLQAQWDNLIAPGLALYRALSSEGTKDRETVLDEVKGLFHASFFVQERKLVKLLNLLPDPYPLVRFGLRSMTKNHYLPGASEVIEDSKTCFAANTYRCFILDTLTKYDAPELIHLYCKTDDWLAAEVTKVRWLRTKTLANGDELCDFRWCRQNVKQT